MQIPFYLFCLGAAVKEISPMSSCKFIVTKAPMSAFTINTTVNDVLGYLGTLPPVPLWAKRELNTNVERKKMNLATLRAKTLL